MITQEYQIKYLDFSGPANLLLELVRKRKIDIYKIKLSFIISDFINYIKNKKSKLLLLDTLSSFLYIASILLEIKSSSIIPSQRKSLENDSDFIDESVLVERQKEYKIYKKIAKYFEKLIETERLYYVRESPIEKNFIDLSPDFFNKLNIESINIIASKLLKKEDTGVAFIYIYTNDSTTTISDEIKRVKDLLQNKDEINFKQLTEKYQLLIDKIICFLSILELYKREEVDVIQFENFGDIIIKRLHKNLEK